MSEHVTRLRKAAEEIRREGHAGWGNTCEEAADEIERLRSEVRLLHASGILATGLDLVQIRALTEALDGEGQDQC